MPGYANCTVKSKQCPGRVQCKKVLSKLGADSSRSMGFKNHFRRVTSSVSCFTPGVRGKGNLCKKYISYVRYFRRGGKIISKRCYRICPQRTRGPGVLQYLFHSSKKRWRNKANLKFKTSQCIPREGTFQNGDFTVNHSGNAAGGLGCVNRSEGCLSTHSSSCSTQKISKVLYSRSSLPVQGNAVWSCSRAKNFHKGNGCSGGLSEMSTNSYFHVPRRLVNSKPVQISVENTVVKDNQFAYRSRTPDKCRKISVHSFPNNNLSGSSLQSEGGSSLPIRKQIFSNSGSNSRNDLQTQSSSCAVSETTGSNGFLHRHSAISTITYAPYPVIPPMFLAPTFPWFTMFNTNFPRSFDSPSMVAGSSQFVQRGSSPVLSSHTGTVDGRFPLGVGGSSGTASDIRSVDRAIQTEAHQFSGDASSVECSEEFSRQSLEQESSSEMRQCNCCCVHKQARGHQVGESLHPVVGYDAMVCSEQNTNFRSPYSGEKELSGRQIVKRKDFNQTDRVESERDGSKSNFSSSGVSKHRLVCDSAQQKTTSFLQPISRCECPGMRCTVHNLEKHVCLCLPTSNSSPKSIEESSGGGLHSVVDSTNSSSPVLVPSINRTNSRYTHKTTSLTRSVKSKQRPISSSSSTVSKSGGLEGVKSSKPKRGFSKAASKLLEQSKRESTKRLYRARLQIYKDWCTEWNINPLKASVEELADFFVFLLNEKKCKVSTIVGYRSAIASLHKGWSGSTVGTNSDLSKLMKGMYNTHPNYKALLPNWDLPSVLWRLCDPPFEPLNSCDLKFLTWKCVFLLALASASRVSELHALSIKEGNIRFEKHGIRLLPDLNFISKTQRLNNPWIPVFIPSFSNFATEERDLKLCPYRALKSYIHRNESRRNAECKDALFITYQKGLCKAASKNTVARWIVSLLKFIHNEQNLSLFYVRAHDTRKLSTSWALFNGAPLKDIMKSAHWKTENTFTSYYMKDVPKEDTRFARCAILETAKAPVRK